MGRNTETYRYLNSKNKRFQFFALPIIRFYPQMSKIQNVVTQALRSVGKWSLGVDREDSIRKAYEGIIESATDYSLLNFIRLRK